MNPLGEVSQTVYDAAGEPYCTVSPANYAEGASCALAGQSPNPDTTVTSYDAQGRPVQVTNPLGGVTLTQYDGAGNVTQTTVKSDNPNAAPNVVTESTYDADNRLATRTVGYGSSSPETTYTAYDPNGNTFCTAAPNGYKAGYVCPMWQSAWIASPPTPSSLYPSLASNVTISFYDADSNQVQTTNPDVDTTITAVDGDGRSYCSVDPSNYKAGKTCPATPLTSPPATGSNPGYVTTIYDPAGRVKSSTDQAGDTTSYTNAPGGQTLTTTDPRGQVTINCDYYQDAPGQCAQGAPAGGGSADDLYSTTTAATSADPSGETTTYTYYPGGQTDVTTTPAGTSTDGYNAQGDLTSTVYANTATGYTTPTNLGYNYNEDGSRHTMTDATGTTTYSYDAAGDISSQALVAAGGTGLANQTTAYNYDNPGEVGSVSYPAYGSYSNPTVTYGYDPTGSMTSESDWLGNQVSFGHDGDGNPTSQANNISGSNPNGTSSTTFVYDQADQNTSANSTLAQTCGGNETLTQQFNASGQPRNPDGQLSQDTASYTGSCSGQGTIQQDYSYDPAGRVVYQGNTPQGSSPNTFAYDPAGDPTTISSHDSAGHFDTYTQSFDNAGEALTQTPVSGSQGASTSQRYDSLGDRIISTGPTGTTSSGYNQVGQLTSVTPASAGSSYTPITPTRVCDTRDNSNTTQCHNKTFQGQDTRTVSVSGAGLPVPATATAIVANVTAVNSTPSGNPTFITVYPAGAPQPVTANLNVGPQSTVNNQVTVGLGTTSSGAAGINIYNLDDTVDVIVDIVGYYTAGNGQNGYTPITPVRICDTRSGKGTPCSGFNGGVGIGPTEWLTVTAAGTGLPAPLGATAVVADLTAISPTQPTFLSAAAQPQSGTPTTASVNAGTGAVVNKEVTIPINPSNGELEVYNDAGDTQITIDVEGYFSSGSASVYSPVQPERICDTRSSNTTPCEGHTINTISNDPLVVPASGITEIPATATAIVANVTALNETAAGFLTIYPDGATRPNAAQMNYTTGAVTNNEVTVAVTDGKIDIYSTANTDVVVDVMGYYTGQSGSPPATYLYNGDGLEASSTPGGSSPSSQYDWNSTGTLPLLLSDTSNDYIYGPAGTPVEQINLTTSTPTYLTYTPSDDTWLTTNQVGDETGYWGYDAYGTVSFGTPTSPFGYSGQYQDATTGLVNDRARWYQPQTGGFTTRDPAFNQTDTAYTYAGDDPVNSSDPTGLAATFCGAPGPIAVGVTCAPAPVYYSQQDWPSEHWLQITLESINPTWRSQYYAAFPAVCFSSPKAGECIQTSRYYDLYNPAASTAYELKVGNQTASSRNESQVEFDILALTNPSLLHTTKGAPANIYSVQWLQYPKQGDEISGIDDVLLGDLSEASLLTGGQFQATIYYITQIDLIGCV